ncbi:MAG: transcriptional repressor [FCB group bacterium]|nr:transcriptional repressor [FCB group bacterium]
MRFSAQRTAILNFVKGVKTHPTAHEIYEHARDGFPNISLGTVYRNLNQLVENNLLLSIVDNNIQRYDGNLADHQHFLCLHCEELYDVNISLEDFVLSSKAEIGHEVHGTELKMTGICKYCKK